MSLYVHSLHPAHNNDNLLKPGTGLLFSHRSPWRWWLTTHLGTPGVYGKWKLSLQGIFHTAVEVLLNFLLARFFSRDLMIVVNSLSLSWRNSEKIHRCPSTYCLPLKKDYHNLSFHYFEVLWSILSGFVVKTYIVYIFCHLRINFLMIIQEFSRYLNCR